MHRAWAGQQAPGRRPRRWPAAHRANPPTRPVPAAVTPAWSGPCLHAGFGRGGARHGGARHVWQECFDGGSTRSRVQVELTSISKCSRLGPARLQCWLDGPGSLRARLRPVGCQCCRKVDLGNNGRGPSQPGRSITKRIVSEAQDLSSSLDVSLRTGPELAPPAPASPRTGSLLRPAFRTRAGESRPGPHWHPETERGRVGRDLQ